MENKFIYLDCECQNDPNIVGWKNYKSQGLSVCIIGYPSNANSIFDENAQEVQHLFPHGKDLKYVAIYDATKVIGLVKKFVENGCKIVGYNSIMYDNNLLAEVAGKLNPKHYMNVAIGGNKGNITWGDVEMGYIDFLVDNKAGKCAIAEVIKEHREQTTPTTNGRMFSDEIKSFLDENTYDIMHEMLKITGGKWVSPLNLVCNLTFGHGKSDNGAEVPKMYKNGEIDRITKYCKHDVRVTWLLHEFIRKYKYVLIPQHKDLPHLTPYHAIKVPFDGSVKNMGGEYIHTTAF